ncbi:MAG TPA: hypothetical protein VHX65_06675 [Pirellulales bacterium]|jgi:hypothetical protein|nr:hypothetical protein [Pirellulales bacterium]
MKLSNKHKAVQLLTSFSGFAAIGCLLVALSTFLTWHIVPIFGVQLPVSGFWSSVQGKVVFGIFVALALFFILTYSAKAVSLWRPLVLAGASIALICFWVWHVCFELSGSETVTVNGAPSTRPIVVSLGEGFYVTGALALALLFLSAIQIRLSLINRDTPKL